MEKRSGLTRLLRAAASLLTVLILLVEAVPLGLLSTAHAATAPTLNISLGTKYFYSVSGKNLDSVKYGTATATASKMSATLSGTTVTIQESENNKLFELGYVPIIASVTVPANTTYRTNINFALVGDKHGTGSSNYSVELFDFGSSDGSSSLSFSVKNGTSSTYKKAGAYDTKKRDTISASYSATVEFKNDSTSDKTISHYFGFMAGVHYGSGKNHKLEATCNINFSRLVDGNDVTPYIQVDGEESRTYYNGSSQFGDTTAKTVFMPDKPYASLSAADQKKLNDSLRNNFNGTSSTVWDVLHLTLSTEGNNKLVFSSVESSHTSSGRLAYTPFTVSLNVPAHTKRTFYLTFELSYERNTGSGAGFFAELIEGDVPSSFNSSASASMTGNTKLRVYSTGGNAHSGAVEIPVTVENTSDSAMTKELNYVFYVGQRRVGVYNPHPVYTLELKDIAYATYEDEYSITVKAPNCTYTGPTVTTYQTAVSATLAAKAHYSLPSSITVTVDGTALTTSQYTYNKTTGKITIPKLQVRGNIVITADAVPDKYTITYKGLEGASLSTKPTTHTYDKDTTVGNPSKRGYTFAGWMVNVYSEPRRNLVLGAKKYTDNITLTATWTPMQFKITYDGLDGASLTTKPTTHIFGTDTEVGNPTKTGYTFAGWTINGGTTAYKDLTLSGTDYTAAIALTATWTPNKYAITYIGLNGASLSPKPASHTYGTDTKVGDPTKTGYAFAGWRVNSGTALYKGLTLGATAYTSGVTLTATWTANKYAAGFSGNNVTAVSGFGSGAVTHGSVWTGKIVPADGYSLPDSITITVSGKTLSAGYTYNSSTGVITVPAASATGAITVTAEGCLIEIINVTITWNDMAFTYTDGPWDPEKHEYTDGRWSVDVRDGGMITVVNAGNTDINVVFTYEKANTDSAVEGSFVDDTNAPVEGPLAVAVGEKKYAWLLLSGKPEHDMQGETVGTVTVRLGGTT